MAHRLLLLALLLVPAVACSRGADEGVRAEGAGEPDSSLRIPAPAPIPRFPPPDLAPGSPSIVIELRGEPDAEALAANGGRLTLNTNDTQVEIEAVAGDTRITLLEKAARKFQAAGWKLHLEEGEQPRLWLHLRPGAITLSVQVSSQVPGVGVSWGVM